MKIVSVREYDGRNIYSHRKCIRMDVSLEGYEEIPSKDISGFNDKLLEMVPELLSHKCAYHEEFGFKKRLIEGTYLAHICEHTIIALCNRISMDVSYGKAREIKGDLYYIIYEYQYKNTALEIGKIVVELINSLICSVDYNLNSRMEEAVAILRKEEIGPSTYALLMEAKRRGIPNIKIGDGSFYQLGYGKKSKLIEATITGNTRAIAVDVASDKLLTKEILFNQNLPVARGGRVSNTLDLLLKAESIGYPVVLKPRYGNQGRGVVVNIRDERTLLKEYNILKNTYNELMIEKYIEGDDYRVLLVDYKVVAVSRRVPPEIIGDGLKTVHELIEELNCDPRRGDDHEKPLTKVKITSELLFYLSSKGITLNTVLNKGDSLRIRDNANLSTGGISIDYSDKISKYNCTICERAAKAISLDVCGIDLCSKDLSKPLEEEGIIVEVNAAPGIRMHEYPCKGEKRNVSEDIIASLFNKDYSTIPLISVTGTNGKTTTTRAIGYGLRLAGYNVGMATTGGIYIGDNCIEKGDTTGPDSAMTVLLNREIDAAVLETARGGIVRRGLAYDLADVAVITNITEDHLSIDGIDTMEELAKVKALVGEAVKDNGYVVINADDFYSISVLNRFKNSIVLFSKNKENPLLIKNYSKGGSGVYEDNGYLYIKTGDEKPEKLIAIEDIKMTLGGILDYNIENAMAVVSALYSLAIPLDIIKNCLMEFDTTGLLNPGRFNLYELQDTKVILDYGHNIEGYKAALAGASKIPHGRFIGIIGVPGDRTDSSILELGKIAASYFDFIYIKEDKDKRGRQNGEIAELLKKGVLSLGFREKNIKIILEEDEALKEAIDSSRNKDLIIVFFEKYEPLLEIVENRVISEKENLI